MALLNGVALDGGTIEITLAHSVADPLSVGSKLLGAIGIGDGPPTKITGVEAISYSHSLSTSKPKGVGQIANRGYTPGIIEIGPGSMEIWISELSNWVNAYGGVQGFYNHQFDVTVSFRVVGYPLQVIKFLGCRPIGVSTAHSLATSDNLVATLDFAILNIDYGNTKQSTAAAVISNVIRAF